MKGKFSTAAVGSVLGRLGESRRSEVQIKDNAETQRALRSAERD
jgi:hypothetical protein